MRLLLVASAVAAAVLLPSLASADSAPAIRLAGHDPLTVVGTSFAPLERVRVTVSSTTLTTVTTRSTAAGTFRVVLDDTKFDRCDGFRVRAVGLRRGDVAFLKLPLPACIPQRSP